MKVTADDIAQLLASPPPRPVPPHVFKAMAGGGAAWAVPLFGLVFGGFGMIFVVLFFPWNFLDDWRLAANSARTTPGVITEVTKTNMSINKERVMEYGFRYTPEDGRLRQGRCFSTGERWTRNDAVTVRYLPGRPELACVAGARLSEGGGFGAFVIIFPLIGGALTAGFFVNRQRTRRLLRDGLVAEVDVVSVHEMNLKVNDQPAHRIVISNPAQPGGPPVTIKRVKPADVALARKHAKDKQPVFILYDPRKPSRLIFPEALMDSGA